MKKTFSNFYTVIVYKRIITGLEKKNKGLGRFRDGIKIFFRRDIFKMYIYMYIK